MRPHKIMVPVGYEPDIYVPETQEDPSKIKGTVEDYQAMWRNFVRIFNDVGADNVDDDEKHLEAEAEREREGDDDDDEGEAGEGPPEHHNQK